MEDYYGCDHCTIEYTLIAKAFDRALSVSTKQLTISATSTGDRRGDVGQPYGSSFILSYGIMLTLSRGTWVKGYSAM